jgi:hypothetical protein
MIVAIVGVGIVLFMPDMLKPVSDSGEARIDAIGQVAGGRTPRFQKRFEAGASCAELMSIRDTFDPASLDVARMNDQLRSVGCTTVTSTRVR